jgi:hypothetical protein
MAELFPYRVVLNGIVLASSTRETVIAVYMTYRAFAGRGRHEAFAGSDRCERQSAPGLWPLHQAWLIGCRRASRMGFCRPKKRSSFTFSTLVAIAVPGNAQGYQMRYVYSYP